MTITKTTVGAAAAGLTLAFGAVVAPAATPAAAAVATVECNGTARNTTVKGNLVVPAGANCQLDKVVVKGTTTVNGNLLVMSSRLAGDVEMNDHGYLNSWNSTMGNYVYITGAWGAYLDQTKVAGGLVAAGTGSAGYPRMFVRDTAAKEYFGAVKGGTVADRVTVTEDLHLTAYEDDGWIQMYDSTVGGATFAHSPQGGIDVVRSKFAGKTEMYTKRVGQYFRESKFAGDLYLSGPYGQIDYSGVEGTADAWEHMTLWGKGNSFHGKMSGAFAKCFPGGVPDAVEGCTGQAAARQFAGKAAPATAGNSESQLKAKAAEVRAKARAAGRAKLR